MAANSPRRDFIRNIIVLPALAGTGIMTNKLPAESASNFTAAKAALKISLNAYSFNDPLRKGTLTLDGLLDFCALHGFDAVDLTGYYFPGYPVVPTDEYIFQIKRKAFRLGIDISGTGVRNDFTDPDESKRKADVQMVKNWIEVASKLGAPVIRIFSGVQNPKGYTWDQVAEWMMKDVRECVEYGRNHGVVVAIQNHNDFIQTGEQVQRVVQMAGSEWFGLVLDIGSFRVGDPFEQIRNTALFAVNWQIKENMFVGGAEVKTDLEKVMAIVKDSGYRGYLPIETLGTGDPAVKVPVFLAEVRKAVGG